MKVLGVFQLLVLLPVGILAEDAVSCNLECANGGYCTLVSDDQENLSLQYQSGALIEKCVCQPGYEGIACEMVKQECQAPEYKCHNGAPCTLSNGEYTCDCAVADEISAFAGSMCRKPYTEYCSGRYRPGLAVSFCTNGGKCLADFIGAELHPGNTTANLQFQHAGCRCPPEFFGEHCEYLDYEWDTLLPPNQGMSRDKQASKTTAIILSLFAFVIVVFMVRRYQRRRRDQVQKRKYEPKRDLIPGFPKAAFPPDLNFDEDAMSVIQIVDEEDGPVMC